VSIAPHPPKTVIYAERDTGPLALDLFSPAAPGNRCAVLVLHGGGWRAGAKEGVHDRAAALAAAGFTALAVQYRLLGTAPWPAPLEDAASALAWVRANAGALGIDPGRVAVQGHSAGGHIALMTGTLDPAERPAAIAAFYPATGFYPAAPPAPASPGRRPAIGLDELGRVPGWMLFPPGATAAELDAASPVTLADAGFPPTVFLHGTADSVLSPRSSIALHERLVALGVPSDLHVYAGRGHEFDRAPSMTAATAAATASFLDQFVTRPAETAEEPGRYPFPAAPR
jgi:acetyl esterase/lipase